MYIICESMSGVPQKYNVLFSVFTWRKVSTLTQQSYIWDFIIFLEDAKILIVGSKLTKKLGVSI